MEKSIRRIKLIQFRETMNVCIIEISNEPRKLLHGVRTIIK